MIPVPASPAAMTSFMTGYKVQGSNMSVYPSKNEGLYGSGFVKES